MTSPTLSRKFLTAILGAGLALGLTACGPSSPEDVARSFGEKLASGDDKGAASMMTEANDGTQMGLIWISSVLKEQQCSVAEATPEGTEDGVTQVKLTFSCDKGNKDTESMPIKVQDGKVLPQ